MLTTIGLAPTKIKCVLKTLFLAFLVCVLLETLRMDLRLHFHVQIFGGILFHRFVLNFDRVTVGFV